jgi:hypothetical protein
MTWIREFLLQLRVVYLNHRCRRFESRYRLYKGARIEQGIDPSWFED